MHSVLKANEMHLYYVDFILIYVGTESHQSSIFAGISIVSVGFQLLTIRL